MNQLEQKLGSDYFKNMTIIGASPLAMEGEEYENSPKRTKLMSKVWDVFEKLPGQQNEDTKALCKLCKKVYTAKASSGTSHLRRHIEACLKRVNGDVKQYRISHDTLTEGTTSIKNCKSDLDEIHREIAMMIVIDEQPFRVVEDTGFRHVMAVACPEVQMMSRQTIKSEIISIYVKERENIRELLATCPGRICLTSDVWKSTTDDLYHCVTAHFIDHEWKLQKRILWFKLLPPPYDSLSVGDEIARCMVEWNIEHKVFSITLDNLSTDDCAISMLKSRLDTKKYLNCNGAFFHVGCCGHILNFIVQAGFDLIIDVIGKLRLGVKYVKQSPHRKRNFYIIAKSLKVDTSKKLCLDCPTRWNSIYHMVEIAVRYKSAFSYLGEQDKNFKHKLSEDEWEKVSALCRFLKAFYEVTCMFSGTRYPTSNLYFKGVWKIHSHLLNVVRGPEHFMTSMVKEVQLKFSKYWSEYSLILSCAAILDPRYKIKFVEYCYTKLHGNDAQNYVDIIVRTLYSLFNEYMQSSANSSDNNEVSVVAANVSNDRVENDEFEDYETFRSARFRTQVEKSQLDLYLDEPSHDLNSEVDVLEFWSSCSMRYPQLSRMARDVLTIPVSTIDYASAFGLGRRVISPSRSSLKSKTIQALICLQDWVQAYDRTRKSGYLESKVEDDSSSSSSDDNDY